MESKLFKVFASLGVPGLALGVFYMLFRVFDWQFPIVPTIWVGPIIILFMLLTSGIVFYTLSLWRPTNFFPDGISNVFFVNLKNKLKDYHISSNIERISYFGEVTMTPVNLYTLKQSSEGNEQYLLMRITNSSSLPKAIGCIRNSNGMDYTLVDLNLLYTPTLTSLCQWQGSGWRSDLSQIKYRFIIKLLSGSDLISLATIEPGMTKYAYLASNFIHPFENPLMLEIVDSQNIICGSAEIKLG